MSSSNAARAAPSAPDPLIGTELGSFKIIRLLGRGGMGKVYLGENTVIGSKVAVKFLHPHLTGNALLVSRFYSEARLVNLIGHENIVKIFDMGTGPESRPYFIMEFLDGTGLGALTTRPVEPAVAIPILCQVCDALQAVHARDIVHRDLKPENIVLLEQGGRHFVKVLDFGLAKLFGPVEGSSQGMSSFIVGTPEYMAPEQCNGERADGRADLYSLGIIAYQLATGRRPFEGAGINLLLAHRDRMAIAPNQVNTAVSQQWSDAIVRAIEKRPERRFRDAGEMRDALEAALGAPKQHSAAPAAPVQAAVKSGIEASILEADGTPGCRLRCIDLSRAGFYLCSEQDFPPLCARLKVALELPGGSFNTVAEVVRHVSPEDARKWKMPAGFFVAFADLTPALQQAIQRHAGGSTDSAATTPQLRHDPAVELLLSKYSGASGADLYRLLEVDPGAQMAEISSRGRLARRELEQVGANLLPPSQRERLEAARVKLAHALETLTQPISRALYDAERGNFVGVACCIAAGLTITEAERLRHGYIATHPFVQAKARIQVATASAYESDGALPQAIEALAEALSVDPLNVEVQKRYWGLKRRLPR